jgi:hypothetical protein
VDEPEIQGSGLHGCRKRRAFLQADRHRRQARPAAARAAAEIALDPRHHRADRREIDLVVAGVQDVIVRPEWRVTMAASRRPGDDKLIRLLRERATATLASQAALARAAALLPLRAVRLRPLRRRQAGVAGCLRRLLQPRLQLRDACGQRLHLRPQRQDQRVFLSLGQLAQIRRRDHSTVESRTPRIVNRPTTRHRFSAGRADTF